MADARELTANLLYTKTVGEGIAAHLTHFYEFDWVRPVAGDKISAIFQPDARRWVIRKSGGYDVHQLVRIKF